MLRCIHPLMIKTHKKVIVKYGYQLKKYLKRLELE